MKFFYLYPEELPSPQARTTSIVKSAETLAAHFPLMLICASPSAVKEEIAKAYGADLGNVKLLQLPKRWAFIKSNRIFNFYLKKKLAELAGEDEEVILYVRHFKLAYDLLKDKALSQKKNWKIIFESHEIFHKTTTDYDKSATIREMERLIYTKADGIVFITEPLRREVMEIFGSQRPSIALHLGVDIPSKPPQKDFSSVDEVFYIGSMQPWKGVDELIETFDKVNKNVKLTLIGHASGHRKHELMERIAAHKLEDRVTLQPAVAHAEIMRLLATKTKLCVLPNNMSPFESYTSPLKLFEYMGTNNLIVFSRISTIEDILAQGQIGLGFAPGNNPAMADALNTICANPSAYADRAQNAFQIAQNYTWAKRAEKLAEFIKGI